MAERVRLTVDGREVDAEGGATLLAALWNAGVLGLRRSVGGVERGALCGIGTCFECRVTVDGVPQRRACQEPVREGMEVTTGD